MGQQSAAYIPYLGGGLKLSLAVYHLRSSGLFVGCFAQPAQIGLAAIFLDDTVSRRVEVEASLSSKAERRRHAFIGWATDFDWRRVVAPTIEANSPNKNKNPYPTAATLLHHSMTCGSFRAQYEHCIFTAARVTLILSIYHVAACLNSSLDP